MTTTTPACVAALYVYPFKSARGLAVDTMWLGALGPRFDRRWMLIDDAGRFISQREQPRLALLGTSLVGGILTLTAPSGDVFVVPQCAPAAPRIPATVWDDTVDVVAIGTECDRWIADAIGVSGRVVFLPHDSTRVVDPRYAPAGQPVSLADAFPLLLLGQESLDDLNARMTARGEPPLPMNRFRPNIVVRNAPAYAEDGWRRIAIGAGRDAIGVSIAKPCARCAIPTTDQDTAARGTEPLATLAKYRRGEAGTVLFAQNAIHDRQGVIHLGDAVSILE